jgi:phosphoglycerate dehydrogenase-like enzyme
MKMVLSGTLDETAALRIVPDLKIVRAEGEEELLAASADADIAVMMVMGWLRGGFPAFLAHAKKLRWFHCSSAGVDPLLCPEFIASDVVMTCAKGSPIGALLAEHAFALMLSLTRGIADCARLKRWKGRSDGARQAYELGGKTLGIVGFGGAGQALAKRARAFDMNVIAVRRRPALSDDAGVKQWGMECFHEMLGCADIVVVTVPHTPETEGLFGPAEFKCMQEHALLIAIGRGQTVQTDALVSALENGAIGGAGIDVVDPEPLPDDHPLWQCPNTVITPHMAGNAPERAGRNEQLVLENLKRFALGQPLLSAVDKILGY